MLSGMEFSDGKESVHILSLWVGCVGWFRWVKERNSRFGHGQFHGLVQRFLRVTSFGEVSLQGDTVFFEFRFIRTDPPDAQKLTVRQRFPDMWRV